MTTAQDGGRSSALSTGRLYPREMLPVLISVKRLSRPQGHSAIGRILCQWKIPMTPNGIEPATFRFVAQHLNHCATAVPRSTEVMRIMYIRFILRLQGDDLVQFSDLAYSHVTSYSFGYGEVCCIKLFVIPILYRNNWLQNRINHHHHHHMSVMELGHLLTRSGLTYLEVSSEVCHDSFCQFGNSVSLSWAVCREAFCLHVVSSSSCIPAVYLEPVLFLIHLQCVNLFCNLPKYILLFFSYMSSLLLLFSWHPLL